ncbi:MAG: D-aminoacyl-tRNA deacylase [Gammaproteobacteria bacterium]|nr:D-aminoacyl-tRNA deacylase [Gammaproteobacteria bacterium]
MPQFALAADTDKGLRSSFSEAASPEKGFALFTQLVDIMRVKGDAMSTDLPATC